MNGAEYTASDGWAWWWKMGGGGCAPTCMECRLLLLLLLFPADLLRILTESPPEPKMSWDEINGYSMMLQKVKERNWA